MCLPGLSCYMHSLSFILKQTPQLYHDSFPPRPKFRKNWTIFLDRRITWWLLMQRRTDVVEGSRYRKVHARRPHVVRTQ